MPNNWDQLRQIMRSTEYPTDSEQEIALRYGAAPSTDGFHPRDLSEKERRQMMGQMMGDMDMGKYPIQVQDRVTFPDAGKYSTIGKYQPDVSVLQLDPAAMTADHSHRLSPFHELTHAKDNTYGDNLHDLMGNHFQDTHSSVGFDNGVGRQLHAQRDIEAGLGADQTDMSDYPWLKQVTPQSSNKLPNPWRELGHKRVSPEDFSDSVYRKRSKD